MAQNYKSDDDYNPLGEHVVEIPAREPHSQAARRRSYAAIAVAGALLLGGIAVAVSIVDETRRANAEAAQREELRDGWRILGTLAAVGADRDSNAQAANAATQPVVVAPSAPPPASVVVVNVPAQGAPSSGQSSPSSYRGNAVQASPSAAISAPAQVQALPSVVPLQTVPALRNGTIPTIPAANPGQSLLTGTPPATNPTLPLPNATIAASNPTQPLPSGTVPTSPPLLFHAGQACGVLTCGADSVCCNPSCGICVAPGATCSQQAC